MREAVEPWVLPFLIGYKRAVREFGEELRRSGCGDYALLSAAAKYSDRKISFDAVDLGQFNQLLDSSIAGSFCAIETLKDEMDRGIYGDLAFEAANEKLVKYIEMFERSEVVDNYGC